MGTAALKDQIRKSLHEAMANPATYERGGLTYPTPDQEDAGLSLTVRWHNKMRIIGERSTDDAGVLEGINRVVFNAEQLDALGITLEKHGIVTIPGLDKRLRLDYREEPDGPQNVYWSVIEL